MVSLARKLAKSFTIGLALGFLLYISASIALGVVPTLPSVLPLAGFGIGFTCSVGVTLADDEGDIKEKVVT
jgi:hypothetical protein